MKKKTLVRYGISMGVALVIAFSVFCGSGGLAAGCTAQDRVKEVSDACFVVGALMFGSGVLMWASGEGMFDMIAYGVKTLFHVKLSDPKETYAEYRERKRGTRTRSFLVVMLPGLVLVLIAIATAVWFEYL
ncbi:MAG: DUF3899 domain-containing protein [Lachnospiraceae bacterium]|nr:DUF3899 domain-containing protein [Lachnospiraceae bacterium]